MVRVLSSLTQVSQRGMVEHTKRQVKVLFLSRNALIFSFVYYRSLLFWWPKLKQELVSAITPISRRLLAYEFKRKGMKHGMKMIWTAKIRKLNEEMTPHWLILSCLPKMHVSFVYVPSPVSPFPSPTHKERTGWRWKAGLQFDPVPYLAAQQPRALQCHIFTA